MMRSLLFVGVAGCAYHVSHEVEASNRPVPEPYALAERVERTACQRFILGVAADPPYSVADELDRLADGQPLVQVVIEEVYRQFTVLYAKSCVTVSGRRITPTVGTPVSPAPASSAVDAATVAPPPPVETTAPSRPEATPQPRDLFAPASTEGTTRVTFSFDAGFTPTRVQLNCPDGLALRAPVVDGQAEVAGVPPEAECSAYVVGPDGQALRPVPVVGGDTYSCSPPKGKAILCTRR